MMRTMLKSLIGFRKNQSGASAVEFALAGPVLLTMLFGVLQTGIWLQNYNAMRSILLDSGRAIMIEYQNENTLTDEQIRRIVVARSVRAPYFLETDRLTINIDRLGTSRVTGTTEIEVEMQYTFESFIPLVDVSDMTITYGRPVFVTT